jgi:hypothetical protein
MSDAPSEEMTLAEARAWLRARVDDGEACPCCTQFAKVYRRKVHGTMARALITMWRQAGTDYVNIADLRKRGGGDETKMAYWSLIEPNAEHEALWRITPLGEQFVHNQCSIAKYCHVYNARPLRWSGPPVSIVDALGTRFNYHDLMQGI